MSAPPCPPTIVEAKLQALRELVEQRFREAERALTLYQRTTQRELEAWRQVNDKHLESLNGEQARLARDRDRYLPRETFDAIMSAWTEWRRDIEKRLDEHEIWDRERHGTATGKSVAWATAIAVASLLIAAIATLSRVL